MIAQPADGNVLVKDLPPEEKATPGGIVLPKDRMEEKAWSNRGQVIRSASRKYLVGEVVIYGHYNAAKVDDKHYMVHEDNIQGYFSKT